MHVVTNLHHVGKDASSVSGEALAKIWWVSKNPTEAPDEHLPGA
jgi:hypothetical protein